MISKFLLLLAPLVYALAMFRVSAFQTRRRLRRQSTSLSDPKLQRLNARLASAAGIPEITTSIYEVGTVNGLTTPEGDLYLTRGAVRMLPARRNLGGGTEFGHRP